jgi:transcriptional regulator GlxA family with amidase domain
VTPPDTQLPHSIASVGFLLIPGFSLMSYAAAVEPLRAANQLSGKSLYRWWQTAPGNSPAVASNGAALLPNHEFGSASALPDLLLVCAGGNPSSFHDRRVFAWLRGLSRRGVIMGGISGGPFVLAKAGLLAKRRCTVHWEHMPAFQEAFPGVALTRSLFEIDHDRITCAGGVSALDLMVALITRDHGFELGAAVSDWFLHAPVRAGEGPQRTDLRFRLKVGDDRLLAVLRTMEANVEAPRSRAELAAAADLSIRQLERLFRAQLGRGVHEHYLTLRLGRSLQLLRATSLSMLEIAVATGFGSASHFSRAFRSHFNCRPRDAVREERLTHAHPPL